MIERMCTWCGTAFTDDLTKKEESPGKWPDDRDDIPTLCTKCNTEAREPLKI